MPFSPDGHETRKMASFQYEEMIFQRVCDKAIFGFPNLLRKKIILQILVTEKRVFGAQYGDTGIIKASFLLFFFFIQFLLVSPYWNRARIKRTKNQLTSSTRNGGLTWKNYFSTKPSYFHQLLTSFPIYRLDFNLKLWIRCVWTELWITSSQISKIWYT